MPKILVIVESPGKIAKIQSILGSGYVVEASKGHIIDLAKSKLSVDIQGGFIPEYEDTQPERIAMLKKLLKSADDVLIATDEDREGEMIAWSIAHRLGIKDAKRIVFNSITKEELKKAVSNPSVINMNLVNAQKTRRILDRIVGYELSPILWKNIKSQLSAGRVQSVVVRLIVDRENDIKNFIAKGDQSYFTFDAMFEDKKGKPFKAELYTTLKQDTSVKDPDEKSDSDSDSDDVTETPVKPVKMVKGNKAKITSESASRNLMKLFAKTNFTIGDIINRENNRNPAPPFTTSTLQQEASRKLGMSIQKTMSAAQKLYEAGYITYMRTDSTSLSGEAISNIGKYVKSKFGSQYHQVRQFASKKQNTQEAHEACRPTDAEVEYVDKEKNIGIDEMRLYSLIWRRSVACQMASAIIDIKDIRIVIPKLDDYYFLTEIQNVKFDGFLRVYNMKQQEGGNGDTSTNTNIDVPSSGKSINVIQVCGSQDYVKPPSRYNEASLVNILDPKNLNIGRPSTYATIINTIKAREYVKKDDVPGQEKNSICMCWKAGSSSIKETNNMLVIGKENERMIPTAIGKIVTDYLIKNFAELMEYKFTASMEDQLDKIAEGKAVLSKVLHNFYGHFHVVVEKLAKSGKSVIKEEHSRTLGKHPKTGLDIIATIAKYGPVVQMCETEKKCITAPIKPPLDLDTITLKDALKLFEYPKELGYHDGEQIYLMKGAYGLYLKHRDFKAALPAETETITLVDAIALLKEKKKNILWENNVGKTSYTIQNGPYGRYLAIKSESMKGKKPMFVKIEDTVKLETLTMPQLQEIIEAYKVNKFKKYKKKGAADDTPANKPDAKPADKPVKMARVKADDKPVKKLAAKKPAAKAVKKS